MSHTIIHADFMIERDLPAQVESVFGAFASKDAKERWFCGPSEEERNAYALDFRIGGSETERNRSSSGVQQTLKAHYYDIIENERIVYAYERCVGGLLVSVALAAMLFARHQGETKLVYMEHGIFFDGHDTAVAHEEMMRDRIEKLRASMAANQ